MLRSGLADKAEFKRLFPRGQVVHFDAGIRQGVLTGKLVRVNQQSSTVDVAGTHWLVPHGQLHLGPAPPEARPAKRPTNA